MWVDDVLPEESVGLFVEVAVLLLLLVVVVVVVWEERFLVLLLFLCSCILLRMCV